MTPTHNCNFLEPNDPIEIDKSILNQRFGEEINNMITYYVIFMRENILLNRLSEVVSMELHMLHIIVRNMILNNLNNTMVIKIDYSRGVNMNTKFSQMLADPYNFITFFNDAMMFIFYIQKIDYLIFIVGPHQ